MPFLTLPLPPNGIGLFEIAMIISKGSESVCSINIKLINFKNMQNNHFRLLK